MLGENTPERRTPEQQARHEERTRIGGALLLFYHMMYSKLAERSGQGYYGWDDPQYREVIVGKLDANIARAKAGEWQRWVDVANFAMFLWWYEYVKEIRGITENKLKTLDKL